jgi:hypothetical protein
MTHIRREPKRDLKISSTGVSFHEAGPASCLAAKLDETVFFTRRTGLQPTSILLTGAILAAQKIMTAESPQQKSGDAAE